jgi:hypothetical protein
MIEFFSLIYYYINVCMKIFQKNHFQIVSSSFKSLLNNENIDYIVLKMFLLFIRMISKVSSIFITYYVIWMLLYK